LKRKLLMAVLLANLTLGLIGCSKINDSIKSFESDTVGLKRTVYVYSYTGELLKTYQGQSVRLSSGQTGTILQVDGKRITISNATVVTEEQ